MKRSKAINKVAKYVNNKIQFRDNWELALKQSEDILELLEDLGMSPPTYKKLLEGETEFRNVSYKQRIDPVLGVCHNCTVLPNWYEAREWELESEKK